MTKLLETPMSRRNVLQAATAGALTIAPALRAAVYAQGSDKPEKEEVRIGFIPLTDCASVVMASIRPACPLAVARPPTPPSSAAMRSSSTAVVGLDSRL